MDRSRAARRHRPSSSTGRPLGVASLVLVATLSLAACGDETDEGAEADEGVEQIDPGEPTADGGFAPENAPEEEPSSGLSTMEGAAPIPESAVASGDATTDGAITTQSFLVEGVTPEELINDYQTLAEGAGWEAAGAPEATGTTDWALTMTNGSDSLSVTTAPAGGEDTSDTELSLQVIAGG